MPFGGLQTCVVLLRDDTFRNKAEAFLCTSKPSDLKGGPCCKIQAVSALCCLVRRRRQICCQGPM